MARHKTIPDEQVLDTLLETIMETGPAGLTFARAAAATGLSAATLVQRYGNREKIVQSVLLRAWDRLDAETEAADAGTAETPAGAVDLLLRLMPPETAETNATDGLLLLREDIRDPALRARGAAWAYRLVDALARRLSENREQGKSRAWQMASIWQGAHTWWAFTREETAEKAIRRVLESWLEGMNRT